jgi:DNA-binding NarL/FixJ family response regulator
MRRLTRREAEIVMLAIDAGLTNQQIAEQLVISASTVKAHMTHVHEKFELDPSTSYRAIAAALIKDGYLAWVKPL